MGYEWRANAGVSAHSIAARELIKTSPGWHCHAPEIARGQIIPARALVGGLRRE